MSRFRPALERLETRLAPTVSVGIGTAWTVHFASTDAAPSQLAHAAASPTVVHRAAPPVTITLDLGRIALPATPLPRLQGPQLLPLAPSPVLPLPATLPTLAPRSDLFSYAASRSSDEKSAEIIIHTVHQMRAEIDEPMRTEPAEEPKASVPAAELKEIAPAAAPLPPADKPLEARPVAAPVHAPAWSKERVSWLEVAPLLLVLIGCYTLFALRSRLPACGSARWNIFRRATPPAKRLTSSRRRSSASSGVAR